MTKLWFTLSLSLTGLVSVACGLGLVSAPVAGSATVFPKTEAVAAPSAAIEVVPELRVTTVLNGLDIPWDTAFLPDGAMLVTERVARRILLRTPTGEVRVVADQLPGIWAEGETGLMSLAVDPRFTQNRRFYTCHGAVIDTGHDVRVVAWRLNADSTRANRTEVLVSGIPATSGRHGGCRLELGAGGALFVGTGDAAIGRNPQRLDSLGGKVLRVDRYTGAGLPGNPFAGAGDPAKRKVFTYGHRNVQGLALRSNGQMWSVEHGPDRNDEVNRLVAGGNYGWNPVPGYNEQTPMTDFSLPGRQLGARWRSGKPTVATSGATWLRGAAWGDYRGQLAVAALKDSALRIMRFDGDRLVQVRRPGRLNGDYGRLRSATLGPDGALYLTTSNSDGDDHNDQVLRVMPR